MGDPKGIGFGAEVNTVFVMDMQTGESSRKTHANAEGSGDRGEWSS